MRHHLRFFLTILYWATTVEGVPCPKPCSCLKNNEVYCNRTDITFIPKGIPLDTRLLDLADNQIHHVPAIAFTGLNHLSSLDLSGNGFRSGSIENGALDLPELTDVDLSFNQYTHIPQVLPKNITTFRIMQNNMTALAFDSFVNYSNIVYLDLSNNQIATIDEHTFDPLVNLDTLYLSFNKIVDSGIPQALFEKNSKMTSLNIRFNLLEHVITTFTPNIQNLDFVGNKIRTIPAYAFQHLPNLRTLAFWEGTVTLIEDNAFFGLAQLTILDMMEDRVVKITNNTFNGLTGLVTLYLSENNITSIETDAFHDLGQVTSLWLGDNQLTSLQPGVLNTKYMPHLSELFLEFNPWYCDCHLRWLREKVNNASYVIQDPHLIKCNGPSSVAGKAWDELQPSDFVCSDEDL